MKRLNKQAHDADLADMIREQQEKCDKTYGYRRMWKWLEQSKGIHRNSKTILRVMKKYGLLSEVVPFPVYWTVNREGHNRRILDAPAVHFAASPAKNLLHLLEKFFLQVILR